jgi:hypothetical protein
LSADGEVFLGVTIEEAWASHEWMGSMHLENEGIEVARELKRMAEP